MAAVATSRGLLSFSGLASNSAHSGLVPENVAAESNRAYSVYSPRELSNRIGSLMTAIFSYYKDITNHAKVKGVLHRFEF